GTQALPRQPILCDSSSWRLLSKGCGDRRPTMDGERSRRSFFSPSVQQAPGHPLQDQNRLVGAAPQPFATFAAPPLAARLLLTPYGWQLTDLLVDGGRQCVTNTLQAEVIHAIGSLHSWIGSGLYDLGRAGSRSGRPRPP